MFDSWVEKYRPQTLDEYVFKNASQRVQVEKWIEMGKLPDHVMFSGIQGAGKTSLALLLLRLFGVHRGDILMINASEERGIETIREKIITFCGTFSLNGDIRYVLLDEVDGLSPSAQPALKNVMELYHENVRFILTCNNPQKIIAPLKSRCFEFHFDKLDPDSFIIRAGEVLARENIEFGFEELQKFVDATYPDLRKCIKMLQQFSASGTLSPLTERTDVLDYGDQLTGLIKKQNITDARKLVCSQARPEEYIDIYRFLYHNLDLWPGDVHENVILIVAKYLKNDVLVADREINLAACFVELGQLK